MAKYEFSVLQCLNVITSRDMLDLTSGKYTIDELKEKKTKEYLRLAGNDSAFIEEATEWLEKTWFIVEDFLRNITDEEYAIIQRYGGKIGCTSYDVNYCLREKKMLGTEDLRTKIGLDCAIEKFVVPEDIIVYRAIKPMKNQIEPAKTVGTEFTDLGFMSTSMTMGASYAYFKDYPIVWEINIPAGSNALYVEWFKGTDDEQELLLPRGTTIIFDSVRREVVNGYEKLVYTCSVKEREMKKIL